MTNNNLTAEQIIETLRSAEPFATDPTNVLEIVRDPRTGLLYFVVENSEEAAKLAELEARVAMLEDLGDLRIENRRMATLIETYEAKFDTLKRDLELYKSIASLG